jgi:hypothetical protein
VKTIASHVATYYKKQGKRPRFFIRIPSANIFIAIKTQTDATSGEAFIDKIQRLGTITEEIDWLGGMSSVSGCDMESIELGQRVTLCSEANKEPQIQSGFRGSGRIIASSPSYSFARDALTGSFGTPAIVVGRNKAGSGPYIFSIRRGFAQYAIPAGMTTLEDG